MIVISIAALFVPFAGFHHARPFRKGKRGGFDLLYGYGWLVNRIGVKPEIHMTIPPNDGLSFRTADKIRSALQSYDGMLIGDAGRFEILHQFQGFRLPFDDVYRHGLLVQLLFFAGQNIYMLPAIHAPLFRHNHFRSVAFIIFRKVASELKHTGGGEALRAARIFKQDARLNPRHAGIF